MYDVMLKGGTVIDGTGAERFRADVAVAGDKIAAVGRDLTGEAARTLDCAGLAVTPGFIDTHSHSDIMIFHEPHADAKIRMGCTTELFGQDGMSVAPVNERTRGPWRAQLSGLDGDPPVEWRWQSVAEYLSALDGLKKAVNCAYLVPHGNVRTETTLGFDDRPATAGELDDMKAVLRESLRAGAVGFSTGLIYTPCAYGDQNELTELNRVAAEEGGFFVVHLRNESIYIEDGLKEVLEACLAAGCPLHISHFKRMGKQNWGKLGVMFDLIEQYRAKGLEITADQYPYTAGSTMLAAVCPLWAYDGGASKLLERLADPAARERMKREMIEPPPTGKWVSILYSCGLENLYITAVESEKNRHVVGRTIAGSAAEAGRDPLDLIFDLLIEENLNVSMVTFALAEEDVETIMQMEGQMVCTDGLLAGQPHPRVYGTFPRVLGRYCRERGLFALERAVHKMTGVSARRLGLADRGRIAEGLAADITCFNPDTVIDRATYDNPRRYPTGIEHVVVNGQPVVVADEQTEALPGRVLRKA